MNRRRARCHRSLVAVAAMAVAMSVLATEAAAAARAPGTAVPTKGSGVNTPAALDDPRCDQDAGPYGRWSFVTQGTGPVCVRPFANGEKNGGATARGVTGSTITVVAVTQNAEQTATQKQQGGTPPKNNALANASPASAK